MILYEESNMTQPTQPFEELYIPQKSFNSNAALLYRVYSDYKHYELVEAASALDALAHSSIKSPYKIMRHDPFGDNVLHLNQVMSMEAKSAGQPTLGDTTIPEGKIAVADIPVVAQQEIVSEPVSVSSEPAPLSNDDVNKLLNG